MDPLSLTSVCGIYRPSSGPEPIALQNVFKMFHLTYFLDYKVLAL